MKYTIIGDTTASEKLFLLFSFYLKNIVEGRYSFISFDMSEKLFGTDDYCGIDIVNELSEQLIIKGVGCMCAANREVQGVHFGFANSFIERMMLMENTEKINSMCTHLQAEMQNDKL